MIVHILPVKPLQTNCYIVACAETRACVIIDPGGEADEILSYLARKELSVKYILLTHAHFDHIGAVAQLVEATGARLALHPADVPLLKMGGGATLLGFAPCPVPLPDIQLQEGQVIKVGNLRLHVLHTPGHAAGHVIFYEPAHQVVFDGDVLFAGSIGQTNFLGGNYQQLVDNIRQKLMTLPDEIVVYPGHGPATTIGAERQRNPLLGAESRTRPAYASLVSMQTGDLSRLPLFFVHPADGSLLCYADLVRHLGADQPCFGLQMQSVNGSPSLPTRIDVIANDYIELLRTVQPVGPYRLVGWSMGGIVAFEMARQLQVQGHPPSPLALIASPAPIGARETDGSTLLAQFVLELGLPLQQLAPKLEPFKQLDPEEQLACGFDRAKQAGLLPSTLEFSQVRSLFAVFRHNAQALGAYRPRAYGGPIILFKAQEQPAGSSQDLNWPNWAAGDLTVHSVPGNHQTMIRTPNVKTLVEHLKRDLCAAAMVGRQ